VKFIPLTIKITRYGHKEREERERETEEREQRNYKRFEITYYSIPLSPPLSAYQYCVKKCSGYTTTVKIAKR
jgi:cytidylate kinase